ncbi:hypothetical protein BJ912DRAFT_596691 [Pholiota molesta]|nr:hypothetical protein BJ912DRAFT_596691 [Pholiota molesta]
MPGRGRCYLVVLLDMINIVRSSLRTTSEISGLFYHLQSVFLHINSHISSCSSSSTVMSYPPASNDALSNSQSPVSVTPSTGTSKSSGNSRSPSVKPPNVFSNDGSFLSRIRRSLKEEEEKKKAQEALERKKNFADRFKQRGNVSCQLLKLLRVKIHKTKLPKAKAHQRRSANSPTGNQTLNDKTITPRKTKRKSRKITALKLNTIRLSTHTQATLKIAEPV